MPRSLEEIIAHAEELAERFENDPPEPTDQRRAAALAALHRAVLRRSEVEAEIAQAVGEARQAGVSWAAIGKWVGTSGEAARQRYGRTHTVA